VYKGQVGLGLVFLDGREWSAHAAAARSPNFRTRHWHALELLAELVGGPPVFTNRKTDISKPKNSFFSDIFDETEMFKVNFR
jgi:hypothetical protein